MHVIIAATPAGVLTFRHAGTTFRVSGTGEALRYWDFLIRGGLHGAYGHLLQPGDCMLSDLLIALLGALGREALTYSEDVASRCRAEMQLMPVGVVP